ncbi:SLAM family member 7, partial [Suncus etruscus]|uniref:SLAM family member 7 n=1 Tax=Suncus etruscus TaxID=109475 RepID=UPI00210F62BC
ISQHWVHPRLQTGKQLKLLLCPTGAAACRVQKDLVGTVGGSVIFPLCHLVQQIDSVVWTFNTTALISIQPNATHKDIIIVNQKQNRRRLGIVSGNYSLSMSSLVLGDMGIYRVELHSSGKQPVMQQYTLQVYEHLSRPVVKSDHWQMEEDVCMLNLTCSMPQGEAAVTYSWEVTNKTQWGPVLPVSWRLGDSDVHFVCKVKNPVSSNISHPESAREFCEVPAGHVNPALLTVTVLPCCAIVLVPVLLWRRKAPEPTREKRRMEMSNEADKIMHFPNIIPKENSANTLYSLVQIPRNVSVSGTHSCFQIPFSFLVPGDQLLLDW